MKQSMLLPRAAIAGAVVLASALIAAPAMAKSKTEHLRGTISSVNSSGFTIKTDNGESRKVAVSSDTKMAGAVQGDLANIKKGTYIGTANVKKDGKYQSLEMVIFPPSMKGLAMGNYSWDLSPSQAQGGGSSSSSMSSGSSMTNGTVSSSSSGAMESGSSMTNGTVSSSGSGSKMSSGSSMTNGTVSKSSGGKSMTLKVNYGKGSKTIQVPSDTPTVKLQKGSKSDLKKGAHVFVAGPKGSNPFKAALVIVGLHGTVPPM